MLSEKDFQECLNETEQPFCLHGMVYLAGDVLKAVDPIAFKCLFLDWANSMGEEPEEE